MRNRFSILPEEDMVQTNDATTCYAKLVDAIHATNKKLLKPIPRRSRNNASADVRVAEARKNLFHVKDIYHSNPCEETRVAVKESKEVLAASYLKVKEENLAHKINKAEEAADRCKNKESWALINDITGRKSNSCSLIDGGSAEGRLKSWQNHFTKLLAQLPYLMK